MGHFLDVAKKVLEFTEKPLSAREITVIGLEKVWLITNGKTPWQTMKSKLSTNILRNKSNSFFMRTDQGKFGLRKWEDNNVKEYVADRFQKALLDEEIVVFPRSSLNKYIKGTGLHTTPIKNGMKLLSECKPMQRREAEQNFEVVQLISVFIVKYESKILTYKRTKRLPESRLHNFYSSSFGGHINSDEIPTLFDLFEPNNAGIFLYRELREELLIPKDNKISIKYKGLLYDDSKEISKQHLGIVCDVNLESDNFKIGEKGFLMDPKFETKEEIKARINDFENWSVLLIDFEIKDNVQVNKIEEKRMSC